MKEIVEFEVKSLSVETKTQKLFHFITRFTVRIKTTFSINDQSNIYKMDEEKHPRRKTSTKLFYDRLTCVTSAIFIYIRAREDAEFFICLF